MFCFHKMSKFRIMNVKTNPHFRNSIIIHVILIEPFWDKSVNPTRRNTTGSSCYKNKINLNARNGNHFTVIITKKAIPQYWRVVAEQSGALNLIFDGRIIGVWIWIIWKVSQMLCMLFLRFHVLVWKRAHKMPNVCVVRLNETYPWSWHMFPPARHYKLLLITQA